MNALLTHANTLRLIGDWSSYHISEDERAAILAGVDALEQLQATRDRLTRDLNRPPIVCLCGSTRFRAAFESAAMTETLAGRIIVGPGLYGHDDHPPGARAATGDGDESTEAKQTLDALHLRKIDLADEVLVLNVGGYIGDSTRREIAYATAQGKPVRYLEPQTEEASG